VRQGRSTYGTSTSITLAGGRSAKDRGHLGYGNTTFYDMIGLDEFDVPLGDLDSDSQAEDYAPDHESLRTDIYEMNPHTGD
jgi:hypothetical protein